ncbi:hypothetical protein GCM10011512_03160 [Tersicoccus solisilvae]|uniref:Major facilitator superfamily (MFS) profile domain-containing protein n=1 Tax=Tersicoccus solisilvae TaxID=1882339 RepID=A0ABQ1NL44_9MICC|nr:hypothetical protein [Tersicoccus solisilvae]GGC79889.1 hypothetical protein GCM10011512_03160 [Tersicoccus solisilvae]
MKNIHTDETAPAITAEGACPGHRHWLVTGGAVGLLFAYVTGMLSSSLLAAVAAGSGPLARPLPAATALMLATVALAAAMAAVLQFLPALRIGIVAVLGLLLATGIGLTALTGGAGTLVVTDVWSPAVLLQGAGYNPIGVAMVACALAHGITALIHDQLHDRAALQRQHG